MVAIVLQSFVCVLLLDGARLVEHIHVYDTIGVDRSQFVGSCMYDSVSSKEGLPLRHISGEIRFIVAGQPIE